MSEENTNQFFDNNQRDRESLFSFNSKYNESWLGALAYGGIAGAVSYAVTLVSLLFFGSGLMIIPMNVVLMMAVLYYYSYRAKRDLFILAVVVALVVTFPMELFVNFIRELPFMKPQNYEGILKHQADHQDYYAFERLRGQSVQILLGFGLIFVRYFKKPLLRTLYRILLATGISALVFSVLIFTYFPHEDIFKILDSFMLNYPGVLAEAYKDIPQSAYQLSITGFTAFSYFLTLMMSCWFGQSFAFRHSRGQIPNYQLTGFYLPANLVWGLIISLALILASVFLKIVLLSSLAVVVLLFILFLFGLQGMGIIRFLLTKRTSSSYIVRLAPMLILLVLSFAMPVVLIFLIGIVIPGLGVSEIWIKYRNSNNSTRGNQNESDS